MRSHDAAKSRQDLDQALAVGHTGESGGACLDVGKQLLEHRCGACIAQGIQHLLAGPAQVNGLVGRAFGQIAKGSLQYLCHPKNGS